ncbi:hypothetical protein PSU4_26900 [Pseudonocardia sulfidoxydans NBRC 16205]|uniref:Uncharacterized protein n=2 Tax=Pseudonocardia sulfidoxydans TaxID=54011 RepID=A0A511DG17_9PSEU|nr:hypothetical protein PSU4_26900 [Pseudonocardia sulfidoxydans NBRC 16205]
MLRSVPNPTASCACPVALPRSRTLLRGAAAGSGVVTRPRTGRQREGPAVAAAGAGA